MQIERVGTRTLLLAVVAGWALLAWLLALLGMGGRSALLPDDANLLQPLPQAQASGPARLGPPSQYGEAGARPLFASDRRPHPFSLQPEAEGDEADAFDYVLTSVLITPQLHMAIVQPSEGGDSVRIKLGEAADDIPAWRLMELNPRSAVFEGPEGRKSLDLRTFDGIGGQPPSVVRQSDAGAGAPKARPSQPPAPDIGGEDGNAGTAATPEPAAKPQSTAEQKQMDAIRKRIEARRAQLRQDALRETAPAKKP